MQVVTIALTVYSAVSAVKALKEGNIMGAIMGGFGAYMGLANMGAFGAATAGDATALTAAEVAGGAEGISSSALGDTFAGMEAASGFSTPALDTAAGSFSTAVESAAMAPTLADGAVNIGATLDLGDSSSVLGGIGDSISATWDAAVETGKGWINAAGDLISTQDGSLLAKAGETLGGTGNLMKLGGMAMDYYGKDKALKAKEDAAEQGYQRTVQEAQRKRSSVGAAPGYVYQFGGRKETA